MCGSGSSLWSCLRQRLHRQAPAWRHPRARKHRRLRRWAGPTAAACLRPCGGRHRAGPHLVVPGSLHWRCAARLPSGHPCLACRPVVRHRRPVPKGATMGGCDVGPALLPEALAAGTLQPCRCVSALLRIRSPRPTRRWLACRGRPLMQPLAGRRCDAGYTMCLPKAGTRYMLSTEHRRHPYAVPSFVPCPWPQAWNGRAGREGRCRPRRELGCR